MTILEAHRAIDAVWRIESSRLIAGLVRMVGDVALAEISPSPVVDLNRAVAVSMAYGPAAGLEIVDRLIAAGELAGYHLVPSVRADLLFRLERSGEARAEFERAASLTLNESQRTLLLERASACLGR